MASKGDKVFLTYKGISTLGDSLEELVQLIRDIEKQGKKDGRDGIKTTHFASGVDGIEKLSKLIGAIVAAHQHGRIKASLDNAKLIALVEQESFDEAVETVKADQENKRQAARKRS